MKSIEQLKEFYDTQLKTKLIGFEHRRRQIAGKSLIALGILMAAGVSAGLWLIHKGMPLVFPMIVLIGCGGVWGIFFQSSRKDYRFDFKYTILRKLITFLEPNLEYQPLEGISQYLFETAGFFPQKIDRYRYEDKVQGMINKTPVVFSEVHAETKRSRKGKQDEWQTLFRGLFFIADFNKNLHSRTIVLPDKAEKLLGSFGQTLQSWCSPSGQLVRLEDPEFEKEFVVYGTDQIEARYILSTSLMERILAFQRKAAADIYLSFLGSKIYIAISQQKDLFEPKMFSPTTGFDSICKYYNQLQLVLGIVDDLDLNTRIWSKE